MFESLGRLRRLRVWRAAALLGPAFVASIAYVDPGNVAANVSAGASYGYLLVWVLIASNLIAMFVQFQSAKLGLVTGRSLPELLGDRLSRAPRQLFWAQAEIVAAATDLAEVIGGAIALNLLFGVPLVIAGLIVGGIALLILAVQTRRGQRAFEALIVGLLAVIAFGFAAGLAVSPVDWGAAAAGVLPRFEGPGSVVLAASLLGATVMPHAIYLHSALVRDRHLTGQEPRRDPGDRDASAPDASADTAPAPAAAPNARGTLTLLRATRWDVLFALVLAGAVNIAMLLLAASSLGGKSSLNTIPDAYHAITRALGPTIGVAFAIGLLASGLASTSVGSYAGATIMAGLTRIRVPMLLRRLITLVPAVIILGVGVDPTWALVMSQVVLSFGIAFAVIPLLRLTGDRRVMGAAADARPVRVIGWMIAGVIVVLNVALIVLSVA